MIISKYSLETPKNSPYDIKWSIGYSEPLEELFSLNCLVEPYNHPYCDSWAKEVLNSLSEDLRKEILFFSDHYAKWIFITDVVENLSNGIPSDKCTIDQINKELKEMDLLEFSYIFLGLSAFGYEKDMIKEWLQNPANITEEDLREQKAFFMLDDVKYFLLNAEEIRNRLVWVLSEYWKQSFHITWARFEPFINSRIAKEKDLIAQKGEVQYIKNMHSKISLKDGSFIFSKDPDFSINIKSIKEIYINLSLFIGDNLAVNIIDNKLYLTKNLGFQSAIAGFDLPLELIDSLKALSDDSRLKIIKVLSNGQSTTKELASLLNLSESATSLHLKQLKAADIVETRKEKKYVYYYIKKGAIQKLELLLNDYLKI